MATNEITSLNTSLEKADKYAQEQEAKLVSANSQVGVMEVELSKLTKDKGFKIREVQQKASDVQEQQMQQLAEAEARLMSNTRYEIRDKLSLLIKGWSL